MNADAETVVMKKLMMDRAPATCSASSGAWYRCPRCLRLYWRESTKAWIKSHCLRTGQDARLQRLKNMNATKYKSDRMKL